MTLQAEQRERLVKAKLLALVRALGTEGKDKEFSPEVRGEVAALAQCDHAYVLTEYGSAAGVAAGVLWATRNACGKLTLFVDHESGRGARFAGYFVSSGLDIEVREVRAGGSAPAFPESIPFEAPHPSDAAVLIADLEGAGLEVVVEHGSVRGEVLGLEVARLVRWPSETGGDDQLHLEPGVGRFDRDAVAAVNPDAPPAESLRRTVEAVRGHRYSGAPPHALTMLCREKWIRADLISNPSLVSAKSLSAVEMTIEAAGLRDRHPAGAVGSDESGAPVVVVASSGVDLAFVPLAADLRARVDPGARLVLALPDNDLHPATIQLAALLRPAAEAVSVPVGWS